MNAVIKKTMSFLLCLILVIGTLAVGGVGIAELLEAASIKASADSYQTGDTIYFGSYPQTDVTASMGATLDSKASGWHSYKYYSGTSDFTDGQMTAKDYMMYCDVKIGNAKYRGVKFDMYRPNRTGLTSSSGNSYQDNNGYTTGTTYWFKYEPLKWRVLDASTGLVMCETIIDSQPYSNYVKYNSSDDEYYNEKGKYTTDWETSSLNEWLNRDFYATAFSQSQQDKIKSEMHSNKGYYTIKGITGYEKYDSKDTREKIYLLAYDEARNSSYFSDNAARQAKGSDYAKCQGLQVYNSSGSSDGFSCWKLRSPGITSYYSSWVHYDGLVYTHSDCTYAVNGIRPAMCLSELKNDYGDSNIEEPQSGDFGIKLEKEKYKATLGNSFNIKVTDLYLPSHEAGELIWESSDQSVSIAPHDKYATVTAEKSGYSVITVSSHGGGYSAKCIVFVGDRSLVIGKQSGFLEVGKKQEYVVSLCNSDFVNISDRKTLTIDRIYAYANEIEDISFTVADVSIASVTSVKTENGMIILEVKGINEGITYVTVTYNATGETRYFPICVTNSENTYYINSIPQKKLNNNQTYNIYQSGIYVYNFKATSGDGTYSNISFDAYNTTGIIGSVDIYNESGTLVRNCMIDSFDFQPTDPIQGATTLYYLVPALCTLSYNDITKPFNSAHSEISFKLPTNGYFKINNDIAASTSCLIYNAVNLTVDSISMFSGLKSTLSSKDKAAVTESVEKVVLDYILKITGLDSESGAYKKTLSKLKDEMLKDAQSFNSKNVFDIMNELCTHIMVNMDYVELVKSTIVSILKSTANELLISLDTTGLTKYLYKYQKWENYSNTLTDLNKYYGDGSAFVYNIQGGTKRISNGIIFEGSAEDVVIFRTFEISYGDAVDQLNKEYNKSKLYDISLVKNNQLTQPSSKVKVYIPIPMDYNKTGLKVYRIESNGSKTDMNADVAGNYLVFETNHFSYYALVDTSTVSAQPTIRIKNYVRERTIDYKTTITFTAETENMPANARVVWLYHAASAGSTTKYTTGHTLTVENAAESFAVTAVICYDTGREPAETDAVLAKTEIERVRVNTGFFAKLVAFFRQIFGALPVITQAIRETL